MTPEIVVILTTVVYKLTCLIVGSVFCFFGYRLFRVGTWGSGGDLEAKFKNIRLVLRSAAPGTFFAVLGGAIVVATVWQGMSFNWESSKTTLPWSSSVPPALPDVRRDSK
jgi:hypothetical protein